MMYGLTVEEATPEVEVWPDALAAVNVFNAMATQWYIGMAGATGLRYEVLPEMWRRLKVPVKDRDEVFQDLMVLEEAALETMRKSK